MPLHFPGRYFHGFFLHTEHLLFTLFLCTFKDKDDKIIMQSYDENGYAFYRKHGFKLVAGAILGIVIGIGGTITYINTNTYDKNNKTDTDIQSVRQKSATKTRKLMYARELEAEALRLHESGKNRESLEFWRMYTFQSFLEGSPPYALANATWYYETLKSLPPSQLEIENMMLGAAMSANSIEEYFRNIGERNQELEKIERKRYQEYIASRGQASPRDIIDYATAFVENTLKNETYGDAWKISKLRDIQREVGPEIMYQAVSTLPVLDRVVDKIENEYPQYRSQLHSDPIATLSDPQLNSIIASNPEFERLVALQAARAEFSKPPLFFIFSAAARGYRDVMREREEERIWQQHTQDPYVPAPGWGDPNRPQVRMENPDYRPQRPQEQKPALEPFGQKVERDFGNAANRGRQAAGQTIDRGKQAIGNIFKPPPKKSP
jgi:hypothetical protein